MIFDQDCSLIIDKTYCKYYFHDVKKPLVVTFAPAGALIKENEINENPSVWGFDFVKKEGLNIISFMAIGSNHWYLSKQLYKFLQQLQEKISIFDIRLGYGVSMGAYGISAYANVLNLQSVLLYSPISTLKESILTFDKNHYIDKEAWAEFSLDGAEANVKGYIIYDPLYSADSKHAARYNSELEHLKVPGVGHIVIQYIAVLGLMQWIFRSFVTNTLDKSIFINKVKDRRKLAHYYDHMIALNTKKNNLLRVKLLEEHKLKNTDFIDQKKYNDVDPLHIDSLRDLAVYFENKDINKAFMLMSLAHELRPDGPFIKEKYMKYKKIIENQKQ